MGAEAERLTGRIRFIIGAFVIALILSGVTAFPLIHELRILNSWLGEGSSWGGRLPALAHWISMVDRGLRETNAAYPFIQYGTDWLAFAHLVIAGAFWGPWKDPARNSWVIDWGILACASIIPLAFICGPIRGIPFYWRLIDCSFGVIGVIPLLLARSYARRLAVLSGISQVSPA
ncbi:MAG: putative cytoplasmic rane protein [Fibrobacteres bacterium]|nr:putative cytoplasmic rane protein [Fibrobacterota bacterium]